VIEAADGYANFADLYDLETDNDNIQKFYAEWSKWLLKAVARHNIRGRVLVDLACGTGNTAIPWNRERGWTVICVDRSGPMLREARRKSKQVRWYRQDLTKLRLRERADVVTCHFDALNHILEPRDLQRVFINAARVMKNGGLIQFDLNTDHWFRWLSRHEKLYRIGPHFCMASNEYDRARRIVTFHQMWFVRKGRCYRKREIRVRERAYARAEIRGMLKKAGLSLLEERVQRKLDGKPIRLYFLACKRN
jgi:ubiquinone/menaquinone biosynthesis C-methylase UbiE